jgi:O-acetyl-ADP-ribose deacetylase (regulator of RNase III)
MGELIEISGDLLESNVQYIAHQCNCVTNYGKGLSATLFRRFPWADTYSNRCEPSKPGTIEVFGNGNAQRFVINMYAQYNPGKPRGPHDTAQIRRQWFADCLEQINSLPELREVAFPYLIGCGLAGGDWSMYSQMLNDWAKASSLKRVFLIRK